MNENKDTFSSKFKKIIKPPVGAFGKNLEPNFSIAIDNNVYPLGIPFIIKYLENKKIKIAISHYWQCNKRI